IEDAPLLVTDAFAHNGLEGARQIADRRRRFDHAVHLAVPLFPLDLAEHRKFQVLEEQAPVVLLVEEEPTPVGVLAAVEPVLHAKGGHGELVARPRAAPRPRESRTRRAGAPPHAGTLSDAVFRLSRRVPNRLSL